MGKDLLSLTLVQSYTLEFIMQDIVYYLTDGYWETIRPSPSQI